MVGRRRALQFLQLFLLLQPSALCLQLSSAAAAASAAADAAAPAFCPATPAAAKPPAQRLDLKSFKLQYPETCAGEDRHPSPCELVLAANRSFVDRTFYDLGGLMHFCVPANATPIVWPDGSPRSELRQDLHGLCPTHGACPQSDWRLSGPGRHNMVASLKVVRMNLVVPGGKGNDATGSGTGKDASVVIGQIHGDSSPTQHGKNSSEWEMILKLQFYQNAQTVCAHVKTAVDPRTGKADEIAAGPCANIKLGAMFGYNITMHKKRLTVIVTDHSSGKITVTADKYDYSFLAEEFLDGTGFYFKAGAYCGEDKHRLPSEGCEVAFASVNTTHTR